jgi:hypothetical protein
LGGIWWMYFVYIYESRIMKPVEILIKGEKRVNDGRGKSK